MKKFTPIITFGLLAMAMPSAAQATFEKNPTDFWTTHRTAERAGLRVHATEDGAYTSVAYDDQIGRVVVDRQANAQGDRGYRTAPLSEAELAAGELKLRVYVDRGCVEVYVNDGRQVLSSYSYASEGPRAIKLVAESGTLKVKSLVLHHMKSIGLE